MSEPGAAPLKAEVIKETVIKQTKGDGAGAGWFAVGALVVIAIVLIIGVVIATRENKALKQPTPPAKV